MTYASTLYYEIQQLQDKLQRTEDPTEMWGLRRRIRKLQKMYNTFVTDEQHAEIVAHELPTRGY